MARIAISNGAKCNLLASKVPLLLTWFIKFFDNNVTPTDDTVRADLNEATNAKATDGTLLGRIDRPTWGPAFSREDGVAQMSSQNIGVEKFTVGPPLLLYGWFMVDSAGNLKLAQRFGGLVPKVVDRPFFTFSFRIDLLEDSMP